MNNTGKDAFYFPHDSNAKDDAKCMELIDVLGMEGYGIYWVLIEVLREQSDYTYPLRLLPILARRYNSNSETFEKVVNNFNLFVVKDGKIFYSESLTRRMKPYDKRKEDARKAGVASGEKRRQKNDRSTTVQREPNKESRREYMRVEENKENIKRTAQRFTPPSLDEVKGYITQMGYTMNAESFMNFYASKGWMIGKNPMKDWKAAVRSWNTRETSSQKPNNNQQLRKSDEF